MVTLPHLLRLLQMLYRVGRFFTGEVKKEIKLVEDEISRQRLNT